MIKIPGDFVEEKTSKYVPRTIYLDSENIEKLEEIVEETGLNPSQIFRRILKNINMEEIETKEEKFKRLSKSGQGRLIEKPTELDDIHIDDLLGVITDGKHIDSLEATRQVRRGDY